MNNEKMNQIINEAYENYLKHNDEVDNYWIKKNPEIESRWKPYSKEEFINKCKTDYEFSEKWGLKIEEIELSLEERYNWYIQTHNKNLTRSSNQFDMYDIVNSNNCPTKLITLTYNNETIEVYE